MFHVNREAAQTRKISVTLVAETDYEFAMRMNTVGGGRPMFGQYWEGEEQEFLLSIKNQGNISARLRSEEAMHG